MTDIVTLPVCVSRAVMLCVSTSITIKTSENPTIAKTSSKTIKLLGFFTHNLLRFFSNNTSQYDRITPQSSKSFRCELKASNVLSSLLVVSDSSSIA